MKYPSFEHYEYFDRFRSRWILDEPTTGSYVARPRGASSNIYTATRTLPGIYRLVHGVPEADIFKSQNRPVYIRSLADFGWKLMCYLMKEGELDP